MPLWHRVYFGDISKWTWKSLWVKKCKGFKLFWRKDCADARSRQVVIFKGRREASEQNQPFWSLDLSLPSIQNRNKFLLFSHQSVAFCYVPFQMVATGTRWVRGPQLPSTEPGIERLLSACPFHACSFSSGNTSASPRLHSVSPAIASTQRGWLN